MLIRRYRAADLARVVQIFKTSIPALCAGDYTQRQLDAWPGTDFSSWGKRFEGSLTLVCEREGRVEAFGNIIPAAGRELFCGGVSLGEEDGYLDMLYASPEFARRGAASAICDLLESAVRGRIYADVSKTALPFFEGRGYKIIAPQRVVRHGVEIENFAMVKRG